VARLPIATLSLQHQGQIVETGGSVGMLGAEYLLPNHQSTAVKRFGFPETALRPQYFGQCIEAGGSEWVLGAQFLLPNCQGTAEESLSLPNPALGL